MSKLNFINLIHKKLTGAISTAEELDLDKWKKSSKANDTYAKDLDKIWNSSSSYGSNYHADTNKGLAKLQARMKQDQQSSAKVVAMPKRSPWFMRVAAVAVLLVAAGFLFRTFSGGNSAELITAQTFMGETKNISLSDGSTITLNEGSVLKYPAIFDGTEREVELEGEAFFDIHRNIEQPFHISTDHTTISVLGTSFNVRAYAKEAITEVSVATGKVQLSPNKSEQKIILEKGEKGWYKHRSQTLQEVENPTSNASSWMNRRLAFKNTPLHFVLQDLERHFGVEIELKNKQMESCPYTSRFNEPDLDKILTILTSSFSLKTEKTSPEKYQLLDGICN